MTSVLPKLALLAPLIAPGQIVNAQGLCSGFPRDNTSTLEYRGTLLIAEELA